MSVSRVTFVAICLLGIVAFLIFAKEKKNQSLDGIFVRVNLRTEFYPSLKTCPVTGSPYWLVSNSEFDQQVSSSDIQHLFGGGWLVKITGDVSRLGSYGYGGRYRREVRVLHVMEVEEIDCKDLR